MNEPEAEQLIGSVRGEGAQSSEPTSGGIPCSLPYFCPVSLSAGRCQRPGVGTVLDHLLATVLGLGANSSNRLAGF